MCVNAVIDGIHPADDPSDASSSVLAPRTTELSETRGLHWRGGGGGGRQAGDNKDRADTRRQWRDRPEVVRLCSGVRLTSARRVQHMHRPQACVAAGG